MSDLILSRGSMSALSDAELRAGVEELQQRRETLAAEARERAKKSHLPKGARGPKVHSEADLAMLALLKGDADATSGSSS